MKSQVKRFIASTMIASLIATQAVASSHGGTTSTPLVSVGQAFVQTAPSTPLMELVKTTNSDEFRKAFNQGNVQTAHIAEASKIAAYFKAQGRDLNTITKQELMSLYPNVQEQNLSMFVIALVPLAIAFIGIGFSEGQDRYNQSKEDSRVSTHQAARIDRAQAQIAEAQARAAEAEAEAAEAKAALAKAEARRQAGN